MPKFIDLTDRTFGRLTVIQRAETKNKRTMWRCLCECGSEKEIYSSSLISGVVQSCGCLHKEAIARINFKHGYSQTKLYKVYTSMIQRCNNERHPSYSDYGGRGIKVCEDWIDDRMVFINWALSNGYQEGLTIDRIDNDKGYSPINCQWVSMEIQLNNTRRNRIITINGESKTLAQWLTGTQVLRRTFYERVEAGWSEIDAIITPPRKLKRAATT